jgi:hypothetical protein
MPELTNGAMTFDAEELQWFTDFFGDVPWAVYVAGMDEVHATQNFELDDDDPANAPHTEETARRYVAWVSEEFAPGGYAEKDSPAGPILCHATLLHYGVPEAAQPAETTQETT